MEEENWSFWWSGSSHLVSVEVGRWWGGVVLRCYNNVGFNETMEAGENQVSIVESSHIAAEDEEEYVERKIELGPQFTLKEQLEKDKVCFCCLSNPDFFFLNINLKQNK